MLAADAVEEQPLASLLLAIEARLRASDEPREIVEGVELISAIRALQTGDRLPEVFWTAEACWALPEGAPRDVTVDAVRACIGGGSRLKLAAYGYALRVSRATVVGDLPSTAAQRSALEEAGRLDRRLLQIINVITGQVEAAEPTGVLRSALRIGRAQVVQTSQELRAASAGLPVTCYSASYAHPNPALASTSDVLLGWGTADDPGLADRRARAEAFERFASGDVRSAQLVRSRVNALDAPAITPPELMRFTARQLAIHRLRAWAPEDALVWVRGERIDGSRCWLPAENVFYPFLDPSMPSPCGYATSSGVAAHASPDTSLELAILELIERDAIMWTWIQRVSRERLDPSALPAPCHDLMDHLRRRGFAVTFVNITLDTAPVALCLVSNSHELSVGAAARMDLTEAMQKSLIEAASVLWSERPGRGNGPHMQPSAVRRMTGHVELYRSKKWTTEAIFLGASTDLMDPRDVSVRRASLLDLIGTPRRIARVRLSRVANSGLEVTRAFVPGLVPLSVGWDKEPLGMPRLHSPIAACDGRTLGVELDPEEIGPVLPHPLG